MNTTLHIGESIVLSFSDVIGIFGKNAVKGRALDTLHNSGGARNVSEESVSAVIVIKNKKTVIYYSKISASRLIKRALKGREEK